jgi:hypothetical protein
MQVRSIRPREIVMGSQSIEGDTQELKGKIRKLETQ